MQGRMSQRTYWRVPCMGYIYKKEQMPYEVQGLTP